MGTPNPEKVEKARAFMLQWFHLTPVALVRKTAHHFKIYGEPQWLDKLAQEISYPFPAQVLGCYHECGFVKSGLGWKCTEGRGCGRWVGPGDQGHVELTEYYRRAQLPNSLPDTTD
jgi:hypothetical protein